MLRTIDGDTIEVEQDGKPVKVRLIGVDTPETVHPSKPVEAFGKEASRFTANLLKGESVYLEFDKDKTDKYGRTLAFVYRAPDGLFVNLEIIRQGYGHAYTKYPFDDKHDEAVPPLREGGARSGPRAVGQRRADHLPPEQELHRIDRSIPRVHLPFQPRLQPVTETCPRRAPGETARIAKSPIRLAWFGVPLLPLPFEPEDRPNVGV